MTTDSKALKAEHSPAAIRKRLASKPTHSYVRDLVYGATDGTVTTFAVVSGVAGAGLSHEIVLVLGLANLVADGFSMAASNYLGTRSEQQLRERLRRVEERHIVDFPDGEREEIRQIFEEKGFSGADLERVVAFVTADEQLWVDTMIQEEYGLPLKGPEPLKAAVATFLAFGMVGFAPLAPFVWNYFWPASGDGIYVWSTVLTAAAFFGVGSLKGKVVDQRWYLSGLETLALGGGAAGLAYLVGSFLRGVVGN